jgi:hypothetical protein
VIDSADATMAGQLNWDHKDPFDRMIVTQAARRSLTIATSDTQLIEGALTPVIDTRQKPAKSANGIGKPAEGESHDDRR